VAMTTPTTRKTILTFSEKVNRLQSSSLLQFMTSKGWKVDWNFEADRPGDQALMPQVEHLEAYILNLRFFVQDNEPTSLRNIAALYRTECKDAPLLERFMEVRDAINRELDRDLWFKFNGETVTYRSIFQGMIYSRFAHTNKGKHDLFEKMTTHPFGYMLAMDEFLRWIRVVHTGLLFVNKLNAKAFPKMGT
jgi:hypothetical protein